MELDHKALSVILVHLLQVIKAHPALKAQKVIQAQLKPRPVPRDHTARPALKVVQDLKVGLVLVEPPAGPVGLAPCMS